MRRVPLHARSMEVAQTILGTACAHLEIAPPGIAPEDDDREFFVVAWCLHPQFVPDEKIIFIPEPNPLVHGEALYIQADEVVLNWLPGLRYLVRLRIVEIQDWSTPPPTDDDEGPPGWGNAEDDDSGSSSHNRSHPGLGGGGDRPRQHGPRSIRFADAGDDAPHLGVRRGPTFMSQCSVLVGSVQCPFLTVAGPCCAAKSIGEDVMTGAARPEDAASAEAVSVETGVMVSVDNPLNPAMIDDAAVVLSIHRNDDVTFDPFLPVDLSLLEGHATLAQVVTVIPPSSLVFDDGVSLVGRRHENPEPCGLLGSFLCDMSLLESTPASPAPAPWELTLLATPGDATPPRDCQRLPHQM